MAYGIAVSMASGLRLNFGTMTKPFHAGNAASNGTLAAYLALRGFTARDDAIEAARGYSEIFGCDEKIESVYRDFPHQSQFILAEDRCLRGACFGIYLWRIIRALAQEKISYEFAAAKRS